MTKIYYDKKTGYLCNRYPKNLTIEDKSCFIEVEEELEIKTYTVSYGKFWAVVNGILKIVDDVETQATKEYKNMQLQKEIDNYKKYLEDTDYVISKMNEAQVIGDIEELNRLKNQYQDVLSKRKEARIKINEYQNMINI